MRNPGLEEAQAGIKIARRNINNLRYADDTTLTDKELCLREALAVCTPPAPEPSAKRPGS